MCAFHPHSFVMKLNIKLVFITNHPSVYDCYEAHANINLCCKDILMLSLE